MPTFPEPRSARRRSAARHRAAGVALLAAAVLAAALTPSGPRAAAAGERAAPVAAQYFRDVPLCRRPADPTAVRCYAVARVPAAPGSAHAYRLTAPLAGAAAPTGPSGGYTPHDLTQAYGIDPHVDRHRLTVGVVLWHNDPFARRDLNTFDRHYGFRREGPRSLRIVNQAGNPAPLPATDPDASGEISLDLQTIRSVCRTCRILLVEASEPSVDDLATAENTAVRLGAQVVNNSYGAAEGHGRFPTRVRRAFDHPGRVLVASTGDDGWYGWDYANVRGGSSDGGASFPATSPGVVSVGGTTLRIDAAATRVSEQVWNSDGSTDDRGAAAHRAIGAAGSGCSRYFAAQPWQRHLPAYRAAGCAGARLSADVSADADPATGLDVVDHYAGGWITIGGTSLSAPLISGMFAVAGGSRGVPYPSAQLYVNASLYPRRHYDVRSGGTGYCGGASTASCAAAVYRRSGGATHNPNNLGDGPLDCSFPRHGRDATNPPLSRECNAGRGFDGPTGIGTPTTMRLFHPTQPDLTVSGPARARRGRPAAYVAHLDEHIPATRARSFHWSWGDGRSIVTKRARVRHTFRRAGRFQVSVQVTDTRWQRATARLTTRVRAG